MLPVPSMTSGPWEWKECGLESDRSGCELRLPLLQLCVLRQWFYSLCLNVLFCKMVIMIITTQGLWLLSDVQGYKTLNSWLGTHGSSIKLPSFLLSLRHASCLSITSYFSAYDWTSFLFSLLSFCSSRSLCAFSLHCIWMISPSQRHAKDCYILIL